MNNFQKHRCLIVDHDVHMRRMIRGMLRHVGIGEIEEATDGAHALVMVDQMPFNLIITELHMPILNGLGLVAHIRHSKAHAQNTIPVIGYTGAITSEVVVAVRDAGINEIMVRPFSSGVLSKKINLVLLTPRPFIHGEKYVGPCRRRKAMPSYMGGLRREVDRAIAAAPPPIPAPEPPPVAVAEPPEPVAATPGAISQDALARRLTSRTVS